MSNKNKYLIVAFLCLSLFFSSFQTSQAGFFDWFSVVKWFKKGEQQKSPEIAPIIKEIKKTPVVYPKTNSSKSSLDVSGESIKNWKTYRNEEYKFEIKYPIDWTVVSNDVKGYDYKVLTKIVNPDRAGVIDTDAPVEIFLVKSINSSCKDGEKYLKLASKIATDTGWKEGFGGINYRTLCVKTAEQSIMIDMSAFDQSSQTKMEKILSSLRFVEASNSLPISSKSSVAINENIKPVLSKQTQKISSSSVSLSNNFKKFKDKWYGIEIDYPENIMQGGYNSLKRDEIFSMLEFGKSKKGDVGALSQFDTHTRLTISGLKEHKTVIEIKKEMEKDCAEWSRVSSCNYNFRPIKIKTETKEIDGLEMPIGHSEKKVFWVIDNVEYDIQGKVFVEDGFGVDQLMANMKLFNRDINDIDHTRDYDIKQISDFLQSFFYKNGSYPSALSEISSLYDIPKDPNNSPYYYLPIKSKTSLNVFDSYQLGATYEEPVQRSAQLKLLKNTGCNGEVGKYCYIFGTARYR